MSKTPRNQEADAESSIADASSLFDDDHRGLGAAPDSRSKPRLTTSPGETFDLAGDDPDESPEVAPPIPVAPASPTRAAAKTRKPSRPETAERLDDDEPASVDEVWSRGAEWAPALTRLGIVGAAVLFLVYLTSSNPGLAFMILLVGGFACVLLSYPIVITLERPVRMTPEQALKDYYGALSHHFPHYKRMWLLLSSEGRDCRHFNSFTGFTTYWKEQLTALKSGQSSQFTPLDFEVEEFKSEKSAGKPKADARCTIAAYVRGKKSDGPKKSFHLETELVKGPDGMWYLNDGALPVGRT
jgi:hypothetical protein